MLPNVEDAVTAAARGDLDAFSILVQAFQDMAVGYAYAVLGDRQLAEDAAQEAFIQVFHNLRGLEAPAAFPCWFKKIVFTCCTRITRRKRLPEVELETAERLCGGNMEPAAEFDRRAARAEIRAVVQSLPEEQRSVLILHTINEFSYRQIAAFLDLSESTVTNRLHAARKRVRKELWYMVKESVREISVSDNDRFVRKVLQDVPWIGFYNSGTNCPEDIMFPSVMRAVLKYMGDDYGTQPLSAHDTQWALNNAASFFAGVAGSSFRFIWRFLESEIGGIDATYMLVNGLEQFERAFEAAGYGYEIMLKPALAEQLPNYSGRLMQSEDEARKLIIDSIENKNRPVIALGVVGPAEPGILSGYDEGGEVMIGWSHFQVEKERNPELGFEPSGYFRKRDWFPATYGLILIGEKKTRPPLKTVARKALEWGLAQMRLQQVGRFSAGWPSFDEWAGAVRDSANFPSDPAVLESRVRFFDPIIWELAERRWYGNMFIQYLLQLEPGLPVTELRRAGDLFQQEHDLMWEIAHLIGGPEEIAQRLSQTDVREQIAQVVLKARDADIAAAAEIEKALAVPGW